MQQPFIFEGCCNVFFPFPDKFHLFLIGDFLGGSVISGSYTAEQDEGLKSKNTSINNNAVIICLLNIMQMVTVIL